MSFEEPKGWSEARPALPSSNVRSGKSSRGKVAYLSGLAAEESVVRAYLARGVSLLERRWRGASGEIDLIFLENDVVIFCEVKAAKNFEAAIKRLRPAQMQRIHGAASEYLEFTPKGQLSDVRFDLAVVDGQGFCQVLEGAFSHF